MEVLKEFGIIPVNTVASETLFTAYKYPQKKVRSLEQKGLLIRLKRGLFVVSSEVSGKKLSAELIANHIYGPLMFQWKQHFVILFGSRARGDAEQERILLC